MEVRICFLKSLVLVWWAWNCPPLLHKLSRRGWKIEALILQLRGYLLRRIVKQRSGHLTFNLFELFLCPFDNWKTMLHKKRSTGMLHRWCCIKSVVLGCWPIMCGLELPTLLSDNPRGARTFCRGETICIKNIQMEKWTFNTQSIIWPLSFRGGILNPLYQEIISITGCSIK